MRLVSDQGDCFELFAGSGLQVGKNRARVGFRQQLGGGFQIALELEAAREDLRGFVRAPVRAVENAVWPRERGRVLPQRGFERRDAILRQEALLVCRDTSAHA